MLISHIFLNCDGTTGKKIVTLIKLVTDNIAWIVYDLMNEDGSPYCYSNSVETTIIYIYTHKHVTNSLNPYKSHRHAGGTS